MKPNLAKQDLLTAERAREVLRYDPETGALTWAKKVKYDLPVGTSAGWTTKTGYLWVKIDQIGFVASRVIWLIVYGRWPRDEIDHINRDRSDNRLCNLREATHENNLHNVVKAIGATGFRGVTRNKRTGRYQAQVYKNGRKVHLGFFDTPEEGADAYRKAVAYRGEFLPN